MSNPFAGMRNAPVSQQGQFFGPGRYKVRIDKNVYRPTQNSGDVFLIETTVLESDNPEHPVGANRTWMQGTSQKQLFMSAIKAYCAAAVGLNLKSDKDDAIFKAEIEPRCEELMQRALTHGELNAREVYIDVIHKEKQKTPGEFFNLHVFSPAQPYKYAKTA